MEIVVSGLSFTYPSGVQALQGVSLRIAAGESVAILGENGAGKTTLVKHFNGLLKPSAGQVTVGGWDTREHTVAQLAARVGYVFQNPDDQIFERTVAGEVAFGPKNLGRTPDEAKAAGMAALRRVGLEAAAWQHPYDLHVSQRKLLALAAILAMQTSAIVLDEPTTGQDARGVAAIAAIVDGVKAEGRTVITISHDVDFAAEHFARVIVMARGEVQADGPAAEVLSRGEVLRSAEVEPPQLVRLSAALGLRAAPLTPAEFVDLIAKR
jgi:energy-coupling factor transport system ATP-binding protein